VSGTWRGVIDVLYREPLRGDGIVGVVAWHPTADGTEVENLLSRRGQVTIVRCLLPPDGSLQLTQFACRGARP
jgi:hypothetical protein